jgi:hypothetical protein
VTAVPCHKLVFDAVTYWRSVATGQTLVRLGDGHIEEVCVEDMRRAPPFCGVEEDRGHDPLKHVDARLGVSLWESEPPTASGDYPTREGIGRSVARAVLLKRAMGGHR